MKKIFFLLGMIISLISFSACENEKDKVLIFELETQIEKLENKVTELEREIEKYKNSPAKLYAQAKELEKNKNLVELYKLYEDLNTYHPESKETKEVASMIEKITKEETEKKEKEKQARLKAVNKLKKKHDDISGITWYNQPYFTHYTNSNLFSIYMGQSSSIVWLRLKMSYCGKDWIFFDNAYLSSDGDTIEIPFERYSDKNTENDGGYVWEWIDVSVSGEILNFLKKHQDSKNLKMRLRGKYQKDRSLSVNEMNGLRDVLLAYDVLNSSIK